MNEFNLFTGQEQGPTPSGPYTKPADVTYSERLYLAYKSKLDVWRRQVEEDRDFVAGAQWNKKKAAIVRLRGQTPLTVDCTSPAFEQAISMLTFNNPAFSATGSEDSDVRIARLFADILGYIWRRNNGRMTLKQIIKDYYTAGMGWALAYYDQNADGGLGAVRFRYVDPLNVVTDTASHDFFFTDAAHIIIHNTITVEQAVALVPALQNMTGSMEESPYDERNVGSQRVSEIGSGSANAVPTSDSKYVLELDRYSRIKVPMIMLCHPETGYEKELYPDQEEEFVKRNMSAVRTTTKGVETFFDPASVRDAMKTIEQYTNEFHVVQNPETGETGYFAGPEGSAPSPLQAVPGSHVSLMIVPMETQIQQGILKRNEFVADRIQRTYSIGGIMIYKGVINIPMYPLVPCVNNFDNSVAPVSDIRRVKGLQEYINDLHTLVVAHADVSTNFKMGYPEGAYNENKLRQIFRTPGLAFIPYAPELGKLEPLLPPPLPNELYRNIEEAKRDIERILGIYALMQGSPNDAPNTYKGTVAIDEYGQRRIRSKKDDIEEFLNQLGRVVMALVQAYMTDYRVFRISKPNGENSYSIAVNSDKLIRPDDLTIGNEFRINDLSVGKYDVFVVSGSTLPSNRWALLETYVGLYKEGIIDDVEVLKKTDVADMEGVQQRKNKIMQLQQALGQAQMQIKQLSGDLQTAQRESVSDRKRVEVMSFEKEIAKATAKIQAATELQLARMADEVQKFKNKRQERTKK